MLGAALGLRAMGLLLGVYLGLAIILRLFDSAAPPPTASGWHFVGRSLARLHSRPRRSAT